VQEAILQTRAKCALLRMTSYVSPATTNPSDIFDQAAAARFTKLPRAGEGQAFVGSSAPACMSIQRRTRPSCRLLRPCSWCRRVDFGVVRRPGRVDHAGSISAAALYCHDLLAPRRGSLDASQVFPRPPSSNSKSARGATLPSASPPLCFSNAARNLSIEPPRLCGSSFKSAFREVDGLPRIEKRSGYLVFRGLAHSFIFAEVGVRVSRHLICNVQQFQKESPEGKSRASAPPRRRLPRPVARQVDYFCRFI